MFRKMYTLLLLGIFYSLIFGENLFPPYIDLETTGVREFLKVHPEYDGRGVLIIIMDSGVDVGIEGLLKTSEDKVKILDVRDFTGEGDVLYSPVRIDTTERGKTVFKIDNQNIYGVDEIMQVADSSSIMGGVVPEYKFIDSKVEDLNRDGDTDDEFAFILYKRKADGKYVCRIDLNGDSHLEDEVEFYDYSEKHQYFSFTPLVNNEKEVPPHFALKIDKDNSKINLFFDGNGHGTHVAGIAAGYNIYGEKGFNGVAPGAQIIACKIGDSRKSGGATVTGSMKKAIDFGIEMARKKNMPVVFNMSYGVGSLMEGYAEDEKYLNRIFRENRDIVFCTSNGNSGPGISSAGSPAVADEIISTGALFTVKNAAAIYSIDLPSDEVFSFSSRGGEMTKPDVLAPGSAASTVPDFSYGDRMWGTSMASPHTTGTVALLLSACKRENLQIVNSLIKRALINSGRILPDYQVFDQGGGVIRVGKALEIYRELVKRVEENKPIRFHVLNSQFLQARKYASGFLWKAGVESLENAGHLRIQFSPEYLNSGKKKRESYRIYSSAKWLKVQSSHVYTRKGHPFTVKAHIRSELLRKPGVYSAKIYGIPVGKKNRKENVVFDTWVTIAIPYEYKAVNHHTLYFENEKINAGDIKRYFVKVTTGASHLKIQLRSKDKNSSCRIYVFNPDGEKIYASGFTGSSGDQSFMIEAPRLVPGVYEIDVFANYNNSTSSSYDLIIRELGIMLQDKNITMQYDERPEFQVRLMNQLDDYFKGEIRGSLNGLFKEETVNVKHSDSYTYRIHVPLNCNYLKLSFQVPEKDFLKTTDLSLLLTNDMGETLINTSMDFNTETMYVQVEPDRYYYLEINGAFFSDNLYEIEWNAIIQQYFYFEQPVRMEINNELNFQGSYYLPPFGQNEFHASLDDAPRLKPKDFLYWGTFTLRDKPKKDEFKLLFFMK